MSSFHRITASLLSLPPGRNAFPVEWAYAAIGGFTAIGLAVLWWRLRRLEVVG